MTANTFESLITRVYKRIAYTKDRWRGREGERERGREEERERGRERERERERGKERKRVRGREPDGAGRGLAASRFIL